MNEYPVRANFFDASALVKVFTNEYDDGTLKEYFNSGSPTKFTTPFCLYETLNILKSNWIHRSKLDKEQYLESSLRIVAWYRGNTKHITDLDFSDPVVFDKTQSISRKYSIDLSDAFQILTVKEGDFSFFANDCVTLLVTADRALAQAASEEGVKSWYCLEGNPPS